MSPPSPAPSTTSAGNREWLPTNPHSRPSVARRVTWFGYCSTAKGSDVSFKPKQVVLYQFQASPFCGKVKAFFDYYNVPYEIVEVNPINKKEIKWSDYKKVPIVTVDGEQMVDSSDIVDRLIKRIRPDYNFNVEEEKKWREWVDNHLVHVLLLNIYRTVPEALDSFNYITAQATFSLSERLVAKYRGTAAMYFLSKKLKKELNNTDERAALYEAAEQWVDALKGQKFLELRPIRHLKSGRDMIEHTRIEKWFSEMERKVEQGVMSKLLEQVLAIGFLMVSMVITGSIVVHPGLFHRILWYVHIVPWGLLSSMNYLMGCVTWGLMSMSCIMGGITCGLVSLMWYVI